MSEGRRITSVGQFIIMLSRAGRCFVFIRLYILSLASHTLLFIGMATFLREFRYYFGMQTNDDVIQAATQFACKLLVYYKVRPSPP